MTEPELAIDVFYAEVGRRIRRARGSLTQAEVARRIGLTRSSVANLEAGRQRIPIHTMVVIADLLDTSVAELIPDGLEQVSPARFEFEFDDDVPESSRRFVLACLASTTLIGEDALEASGASIERPNA